MDHIDRHPLDTIIPSGETKQYALHVPTTADTLKEITERVRNTTTAELQYQEALKGAREAAEAGEGKIAIRKMKQNFFLEKLTGAPVPAGKTAESYAAEMYSDQDAMLDMFRKNGFTVTESDPEIPNLIALDINPAMHNRTEVEATMIRRYVEKDVVISWT